MKESDISSCRSDLLSCRPVIKILHNILHNCFNLQINFNGDIIFFLTFNIAATIVIEEVALKSTFRFSSETGGKLRYLFPFVRATPFQMNRPVSERTIACRWQMNRVHARWKPGVAAILEVTGSRPPYHGLGRHDGDYRSTTFSGEEKCHPDNSRGILRAGSRSVIGAPRCRLLLEPCWSALWHRRRKMRKGPE